MYVYVRIMFERDQFYGPAYHYPEKGGRQYQELLLSLNRVKLSQRKPGHVYLCVYVKNIEYIGENIDL